VVDFACRCIWRMRGWGTGRRVWRGGAWWGGGGGAGMWPARRVMGEPGAVLIVALGLAAGMTRWVMRPELVTYLCVACSWWGWRKAAKQQSRQSSKWRLQGWRLVLLQIVWTNAHGLFVLGRFWRGRWWRREVCSTFSMRTFSHCHIATSGRDGGSGGEDGGAGVRHQRGVPGESVMGGAGLRCRWFCLRRRRGGVC